MTPGVRPFVRDNAFLVAAVLLPVVVVGFFLLATTIPRWLVPPPAYDLLLRAANPYDGARARVAVEINVRNGRLEATVRPALPNTYLPVPALLLLDHRTLTVREIPLRLPDMAPDDPPKTVEIDAVPGRRLLAQAVAPDGYTLRIGSYSSHGLFGDLFGMHAYDRTVSLANRGRVIKIAMPPPYEGVSLVNAIGWVADEGSR